MTEVNEGVSPGSEELPRMKFILMGVLEIWFQSGIDTWGHQSDGTEEQHPPGNEPHWGSPVVYPAAYVRKGGDGETKALELKVSWSQNDCDGKATLTGLSSDKKIEIRAEIDIKGFFGTARVKGEMVKKPETVANYGGGEPFSWTLEAKGLTVTATGGSPLRLFFVDRKPRPLNWSYENHYIRVIDWATKWAAGQAGEKPVLAALWNEFSTGERARIPHATGFVYWKTYPPLESLSNLIRPNGNAEKKGWSCTAVSHLFMACLSLHGILCQEIEITIPNAEINGIKPKSFLVANWKKAPKPIPNWSKISVLYYGGSWKNFPDRSPPLQEVGKTELLKNPLPDAPGAGPGRLEIDMKKMPGIPAQGQLTPPGWFKNHWLVRVQGQLYDPSYGKIHANDLKRYTDVTVPGWLVYVIEEKDGAIAICCVDRSYAELVPVARSKNF